MKFNQYLYNQFIDLILDHLDSEYSFSPDDCEYWQEYERMKKDITPLCYEQLV